MRRAISIVVTTLLAVLVVSTVVVWATGSSGKHLQVVRGVADSEGTSFFADPSVKAAFAEHGLDVRRVSPSAGANDDFGFGAATSSAQARLAARGRAATAVPFSTPLAVATFAPTARLLERAGVAHDHGGWWTLDMHGFLDLVARHTRWNQLPGNAADPVTSAVGITSTDLTPSNPAAMYASIAAYAANDDRVLTSLASVDAVVNQVSPLFLGPGDTAQSAGALFHDYLSRGDDTEVMVAISEAQFVAQAAADAGSIRPNMVLLYPDPDVVTPYTLVPLTARGTAVGRLLVRDPGLQRLAAEHGFRPSDPSAFDSLVRRVHVAVPHRVGTVIDPPSAAVREALATRINAARHVKLGPAPGAPTANESFTVPALTVVP